MIDEFWAQISHSFRQIVRFIKDNTIGKFAIISAVAIFLVQIGLWNFILKSVTEISQGLWVFLGTSLNNTPLIIWVLLMAWLVLLSGIALRHAMMLNIATGAFTDTFNKGLGKWDYGYDGWKVEKEDGTDILSVTESELGGITKRGFNWSDYEFSFDAKVVHRNSGWIVRAEGRTKYIMLQLNLDDPTNPKLRPHLRLSELDKPWILLESYTVDINKLQLSKPIKLMEWIKVRIIVRSGEIDAFINNEHLFHFSLPNPLDLTKQGKLKSADNQEYTATETVRLNYHVGGVGFRCAGREHSHFRNVRVKPLLS